MAKIREADKGELTVGQYTGNEALPISSGSSESKYVTLETIGLAVPKPWSKITGTPTTLSGYGITDLQNIHFVSQYASFSAALAAIGSAETTLIIDESVNVSTDTTVPATLSLVCVKGGMLVRTGGTHLTINGPFECGNWQCFLDNTAGHDWVVFGTKVSEIIPQFWGAVADSNLTHLNGIDNTTALQCWLNATSSGNVLKLPMGGYRFTSTLTYQAANSSDIIIRGDGMGVSNLYADFDTAAHGIVIKGVDTSNRNTVILEDFTLGRYNTDTLKEGKLLWLEYANKFSVDSVELYGSSGFTFLIYNCDVGKISNCIIRDSAAVGGCDAIHLEGNVDNIVIDSNIIYGVGDDCIALYADELVAGNGRVIITNNIMYSNDHAGAGNGVNIGSDASEVIVTDNIIYDITQSGIVLTPSNISSQYNKNIIIANNYIRDVAVAGTGVGANAGILMYSSTYSPNLLKMRISISDNTIINSNYGVAITGNGTTYADIDIREVSIKNNYFDGFTIHGIICFGVASLYIENNIVKNIQQHGIAVYNTDSVLSIKGNFIEESGIGGVITHNGLWVATAASGLIASIAQNLVMMSGTATAPAYSLSGVTGTTYKPYIFHNRVLGLAPVGWEPTGGYTPGSDGIIGD